MKLLTKIGIELSVAAIVALLFYYVGGVKTAIMTFVYQGF